MGLSSFMMLATMILGLALIVVVIVQGQNSGSLGSMFGGGSDIYRTRRGIEKTLFNVTFLLAGLFMFTALITVAFE
jgi:preprotein translocase subunit SecG